jgi:SulP family sulfate permease
LSRYTPKLLVCFREGYSFSRFFHDCIGGLTVAIIALPLAMALGIASIPQNVAVAMHDINPMLSPPAMGLFTAVVAGFIISALGGSRVQIGGPTAAFIPIVAGIATKFATPEDPARGYHALALATLMAGVIVIVMGLFRFGAMIKFIPYPVTTGFTAGIAVTILASQIKDFFGLTIVDPDGRPATIPADFVPKLQVLARHFETVNWSAAVVGLGSLAVLVVLRRFLPRIPGAIVAVGLASAVVAIFKLPVETIGSRFGGIPSMLPVPHLPQISLSMIGELIAPATTIAILCSIESLLSAVVADGMTGYRHKSDQELIAQGVANVGSVLFFGVPATGAIARTVANIKSGGKTPVAGMLHAVILLVFMIALAPAAKLVPLPALAAILVVVAWNISELDHFRSLLRAPRADVLVLLTTFGLTVFTDLSKAVGVGMVIASMLFMKRMAEVSNISAVSRELANGDAPEVPDPKDPGNLDKVVVPSEVEIYEIDGPFFFGVADRLKDTLQSMEKPPKVFILRMRRVPHIDASGLHALDEFHDKCRRQGTRLLLGGVHAQPMMTFVKVGFDEKIGLENIFENLEDALAKARELVGLAVPQPLAVATKATSKQAT